MSNDKTVGLRESGVIPATGESAFRGSDKYIIPAMMRYVCCLTGADALGYAGLFDEDLVLDGVQKEWWVTITDQHDEEVYPHFCVEFSMGQPLWSTPQLSLVGRYCDIVPTLEENDGKSFEDLEGRGFAYELGTFTISVRLPGRSEDECERFAQAVAMRYHSEMAERFPEFCVHVISTELDWSGNTAV